MATSNQINQGLQHEDHSPVILGATVSHHRSLYHNADEAVRKGSNDSQHGMGRLCNDHGDDNGMSTHTVQVQSSVRDLPHFLQLRLIDGSRERN